MNVLLAGFTPTLRLSTELFILLGGDVDDASPHLSGDLLHPPQSVSGLRPLRGEGTAEEVGGIIPK